MLISLINICQKKMEDILEEKLNRLYKECINDLKSIGIDIKDVKYDVGEIDIGISKRTRLKL